MADLEKYGMNATESVETNKSSGFPSDGFGCEPSTPLVVPILITLISAVGLVANSIVIFIVTVLKEYTKSVTNIYVLQLAIADFVFLFQLPFQARYMTLGEWTYGVSWCKLSEAVKMLNYYSSILFLTVMSVDRYLAINFAMNQKVAKFRSKRAAFVISSCLWVFSITSVINILIYADVKECSCIIFFPQKEINFDEMYDNYTYGEYPDEYEYDEDYNEGSAAEHYAELIYNDTDIACSFNKPHIPDSFKIWIVCNFVFAFVIPLIVICSSYALIIRRILKPMEIGTKSQKSNKTRKRVTIMVTALVSAFVICWLPYHAFNLARLNDVRLLVHVCDNISYFTIILAYANSAINPFFYTFLGTNFRRRWRIAVGKARKGLRQSIMSHSGDYTPGASMKMRRKSSGMSTTGGGHKNRDDVSVNSFATKHTIVPTKEDAV